MRQNFAVSWVSPSAIFDETTEHVFGVQHPVIAFSVCLDIISKKVTQDQEGERGNFG